MISDKPIDFDRFVRWLMTAGVIVVLYLALTELSAVLLPFLLAWLTVYLLDPLVSFVQRWIKKRVVAVMVLFLTIAIVSVAFVIILVPIMAEEVKHLYSLIDSQLNHLEWPAWIPKDIVVKAQSYLENIDYTSMLKQEGMGDKVMAALTGVWNTVSGVYGIVGALFGTITYVLYLMFLILDFQALSNSWKNYIPNKYKAFTLQLTDDLEIQMNGYFRAQTKIVISVAILFAIGFKIIGLPFALGLGLLVGFLNYIPYMQLIGILPALALAALNSVDTGGSAWIAMSLVLVVFAVIQLIQEVFLTPRFMGGFSGMHPAIILLSLSIWGALLGMVGLIIAIPITAIIISYYQRLIIKES